MILKSTLDEYSESETFDATQINELLDEAIKINSQRNYGDFMNSYNKIGE